LALGLQFLLLLLSRFVFSVSSKHAYDSCIINQDLADQTKDKFVRLAHWNMSWSSELEIVQSEFYLCCVLGVPHYKYD
jgi:hypothetical protein